MSIQVGSRELVGTSLKEKPCTFGDQCNFLHPEGQFGSKKPSQDDQSAGGAGGQTGSGSGPGGIGKTAGGAEGTPPPPGPYRGWQSQRKCRHGSECRMFKRGQCSFRHDDSGEDKSNKEGANGPNKGPNANGGLGQPQKVVSAKYDPLGVGKISGCGSERYQ